MSEKNESVEVPFGNSASDTATLLLAAAEELNLDAGVVTVSGRNFVVPSEVNDKAFGSDKSDDSKAAKKTAKKAPAKKSQE